MANTFSTASCNVFASWKINVIYLFFYNAFGTVFCGRYFFLSFYMTCYNFCKLIKSKGRFRNFAISKFRNFTISKMGLFVTMFQCFQSLTVVINSSILDLKSFLIRFWLCSNLSKEICFFGVQKEIIFCLLRQ